MRAERWVVTLKDGRQVVTAASEAECHAMMAEWALYLYNRHSGLVVERPKPGTDYTVRRTA